VLSGLPPDCIDRGLVLEFLARLQTEHRKNLVLHVLRQLFERHGERDDDLRQRRAGNTRWLELPGSLRNAGHL
jgi:hypothetical protein